MTSLVIANYKGGVGKTTLTCHVAWAIAARGARVAVLDLDPQHNASTTLANWAANVDGENIGASQLFSQPPKGWSWPEEEQLVVFPADLELLTVLDGTPIQATRGLAGGLAWIEEHGADLVVIDTGPSLNMMLAAALQTAQFVAVPFDLSFYALNGLDMFQATIAAAREHNPELRLAGVIPSKVERRRQTHRDDLKAIARSPAYKKALLPEVNVHEAIETSLRKGLPVWALGDGGKGGAREATYEVQTLVDKLVRRIGLRLPKRDAAQRVAV